jgi:putative membrane protein
MRIDPLRLARSGLLLGLALMIAKLLATGQMAMYMSPMLDPLTALAAVLLAGMGVLELRRGTRTRGDGAGVDRLLTFGLVALPLLLGLFMTPRALGASAIGGENASSLVLAFAPQEKPTSAAVSSQPIQDVSDLLAFLRRTGEAGIGQPVHAIGLVAHSPDLPPNEFILLRYMIVHCVADARPIGLLVASSDGGVWGVDQWVAIDGSLASREHSGDRLVTIVADRIVPTDEPGNPYLPAF